MSQGQEASRYGFSQVVENDFRGVHSLVSSALHNEVFVSLASVPDSPYSSLGRSHPVATHRNIIAEAGVCSAWSVSISACGVKA